MIEDTAQAVGARLKMAEGKEYTAGTVGDIGTFSFFPSKNLGCYGDGGAVCTNDKRLAERIRMVARHGQRQKYVHEILGCNSRLDSLQAAVLSVKLRHLESWTEMRIAVARRYNEELGEMEQLSCPVSPAGYRHVYHQYTIRVKEGRDELQEFLKSHGVPSVVYYLIPLHRQKAFLNIPTRKGDLEATEHLVDQVLSIPMDSELDPVSQGELINKIKLFYTK
jgi:dTDP-4-amino-4,6-dideoxygalactose transaminase